MGGRELIGADQTKQICHIVARLVDVIEALALQQQAGDFEITKLRNIRHDSLMLLDSLGHRAG